MSQFFLWNLGCDFASDWSSRKYLVCFDGPWKGPAVWFLLEPDEINIKELSSCCLTSTTLGAVTKLPLISKLSSSCEDEKMVSEKCHSWMLIPLSKVVGPILTRGGFPTYSTCNWCHNLLTYWEKKLEVVPLIKNRVFQYFQFQGLGFTCIDSACVEFHVKTRLFELHI